MWESTVAYGLSEPVKEQPFTMIKFLVLLLLLPTLYLTAVTVLVEVSYVDIEVKHMLHSAYGLANVI